MMTLREKLERALAIAPFSEIYRYALVSAEDGCCTIATSVWASSGATTRNHRRSRAYGCRSVCMWLALQSRFEDRSAVTSSMDTHFLRKASDSDLLCRARIIRAGRRLVFEIAECSLNSGELLSYHTVTYMRNMDRLCEGSQ